MVVHHDAIKIVEAPKPIVQVREQIVQQPIVQVREQIVEPVVQVREQQIVQHREPVRIVEEQVKIGHLVEAAPVVQQRKEITTTNEVVHHADIGSFASASDRNSDWRENRSWSTSRTVWGNLNETNSNSNNSSRSGDRSNEATESTNSSSNSEQSGRSQSKPITRRFLGEEIFTNIPETNFTCEGKAVLISSMTN